MSLQLSPVLPQQWPYVVVPVTVLGVAVAVGVANVTVAFKDYGIDREHRPGILEN